MANPTFFDLFNTTWGQNGLTEAITDLQYKTGWAFIGSVPPSVEQFNKVQQVTDERLAWIYKQLDALATVTGQPLAATTYDALRYAFENLNASNLKSGTVPVGRLSGTATALTAGAATKLVASRSFSITGGVTAAAKNFDGTADVTLEVMAIDLSKADAGALPISRIEGLQSALDKKANATVEIVAGSGLTGGGTLQGEEVVITLGAPSTVSTSSSNSATGATHSHALQLPAATNSIVGIARQATLEEGYAGASQVLITSPYVVYQMIARQVGAIVIPVPTPPALTDIRLGSQIQVNGGGQVVPAGCVSTGANTLDDNRINRQWYRPLQKLWYGSWVTVAVES